MGYQAVWRVLEGIIKEFTHKGETIPLPVMGNLKSAKVMIEISSDDTEKRETAPKIEEYLSKVEAYLLSEAPKFFDEKHIDEWLRRIDEASIESCLCQIEKPLESRFVPGVPRDKKWIRVTPDDEWTVERLQKLAKDTNLLTKLQGDGLLLVYGADGNVKKFIKRMTEANESMT